MAECPHLSRGQRRKLFEINSQEHDPQLWSSADFTLRSRRLAAAATKPVVGSEPGSSTSNKLIQGFYGTLPTHSAGLSTGQGLLPMTELAGGNVQEEPAAEAGGDPLMEEEAVNWTQAGRKTM